jgi:hypothetical protein
MSFNFKGVESAKANSYLKPGYYRVRVSEVVSGEFDSGIPYLAVTFTTQDKLSITEKFVLKVKDPNSKFNPLSRLVYLHEAWLGSEIDAEFKSVEAVAAFFKKALVSKAAGPKTLVVGGEINGKITYGRIPLTDFIVDGDVDLGPFEEDSEEWKQFVKKSTRTTEASGKKGGLLNSDDDDDFGEDDDDADDADEDTPPPPPAKGKNTKAAAPKAEKAPAKTSSKKKEEPKEEAEEEGEDDGFNW